MTNQLEIDCAVLSSTVYTDVRQGGNETPSPDGWTQLASNGYVSDMLSTGLTCGAYTNGLGEIVIAFKGTDTNNTSNTVWDWVLGNIPGGLGIFTPQIAVAMEYYEQIKAANPGANIIFTGHSLGGGIASVLGIYFNRQSFTFNEAPFVNQVNTQLTQISANLALLLHEYQNFLSSSGFNP